MTFLGAADGESRTSASTPLLGLWDGEEEGAKLPMAFRDSCWVFPGAQQNPDIWEGIGLTDRSLFCGYRDPICTGDSVSGTGRVIERLGWLPVALATPGQWASVHHTALAQSY